MRRHLTYANATATLALFVALGGIGYAAATITGDDVVDNSLTGRDVNERTLERVCPGTARRRAGDVCYGRLRQAADWNSALDRCQASGLRLPSIAEGFLVLRGEGNGELWTDEVIDGQLQSAALVVRDKAGTDPTGELLTNARPYRCVASPR